MATSYDLTNYIRDVDPMFTSIIARRPSLLSYILAIQARPDVAIQSGMSGITSMLADIAANPNPATSLIGANFPANSVKNNKYEWMNDTLNPKVTTLTANSNIASTTIVVANATGFKVGDTFRFLTSTGKAKAVQVQISAISGNTLTVVRPTGGSTDVNLVSGDQAIFVSRGNIQGSLPGEADYHEAVADYNLTQIFDANVSMTRTAIQTQTYDGYNAIENQLNAAMVTMIRSIEDQMINGLLIQGNATTPSYMRGLISYISSGNNVIDASNSSISATTINNLLSRIVSAGGGQSNQIAFIGNSNVTRAISALNTAGSNPVLNQDYQQLTQYGTAVSRYLGDMPILNSNGTVGSTSASIFTCFNMPQDVLLIADLSLISVKVMETPNVQNATVNGQDGINLRVVTELTTEVKQAYNLHGIITNLAVS